MICFAHALGAGGDNVLFADFIEKGVFGQHGQGRKPANDRCQHRQRDMPEIVGDFLIPRQGAEIGGDQPPQREEIEIAAPAKKTISRTANRNAGMA
jgi:hypothetical protein